ncbi:MAG TPA: HAMP domain-containing sensor histidine kinase [Candidatus Paceibacterota bacterium]|nr:HAMP domain-containing sensor histidine kinase [Candidatus Paceibacterota bacterium]
MKRAPIIKNRKKRLTAMQKLELNSRNLNSAVSTLKEQKKKVKALLLQSQKIKKASENYAAKTDVISISAHQIRTSLSAMKWISEMFLGGDLGKMTVEQENLLRKAHENNERAIMVVSELLLMNKTEDIIEKQYIFSPLDMVALVEDSIFNFSGEAFARGIEVIFLKPGKEFPKAKVDKEKLLIVLHNLMDNAIKYSNAHGKIFIVLKEENGFIQFSIKDTGVVVSEEGKKRLFEKFYRDREAMRKELVGSGIGLYTIRKIVERHGGEIWFESGQNMGTTFFFTIPIFKQESLHSI